MFCVGNQLLKKLSTGFGVHVLGNGKFSITFGNIGYVFNMYDIIMIDR